jgi:hypothetical protein
VRKPVGEYQRFEFLARSLFAVQKDDLAKLRNGHQAKKTAEKNSGQKKIGRSEASFSESLRRFAMKATEKQPLQCSFCGKTAEQVRFLVAGGGNPPSVYICGGCVDLSADIIEKTKASGSAPPAP